MEYNTTWVVEVRVNMVFFIDSQTFMLIYSVIITTRLSGRHLIYSLREGKIFSCVIIAVIQLPVEIKMDLFILDFKAGNC